MVSALYCPDIAIL